METNLIIISSIICFFSYNIINNLSKNKLEWGVKLGGWKAFSAAYIFFFISFWFSLVAFVLSSIALYLN